MNRSAFFDIACENPKEENQKEKKRDEREDSSENFRIYRGTHEMHGSYSVFFTEPIWKMGEQRFFAIREQLAKELGDFISDALIEDQKKEKTLLIAGLGNPKMTADALGAEVVDRIEITRKIEQFDSSKPTICAVSLGVLGTTGMEAFEHLDALCRYLHPSVVVAVDALSAKSQTSVGAAIQISSGGISPGGGVGVPQKILSKETLGIPVISIGVPTVIRSSVMIREAIDELGVKLSEEDQEILSKDSFFMMPKECDLLIQSASLLIASAIRCAYDFSCQSFSKSHIFRDF